jgi:hypothetical protein
MNDTATDPLVEFRRVNVRGTLNFGAAGRSNRRAPLLGKGDAVQRLCGNLQVDISKARSECARRGVAMTLTRMSYFITMLLKYSTTKDCHAYR